MRAYNALPSVAAAFVLMSQVARADLLTVVEVGAPAVNCVFNASCTITVTDSLGYIDLPNLRVPKTAWLQSRTFTGGAGTGRVLLEYATGSLRRDARNMHDQVM